MQAVFLCFFYFPTRRRTVNDECTPFQIQDYQVATTSSDKSLCRKKSADGVQNLSHKPCSLCPSQCGPHSSKCQDARVATAQPSVLQGREHNSPCATERGKTTTNREMKLLFPELSMILKWKKMFILHLLLRSQSRNGALQ